MNKENIKEVDKLWDVDYTNNEHIKKYLFLTATQKIFEKYNEKCS